MKRMAGLALVLALLAPAGLEAQQRGERYNPFSFTPYAGAYRDAYDMRADDSDLGWLIGFRAGYHESDRINLHLNLGYARVGDVGTRAPAAPIVDAEWVLLTAGADYALVPGATSVAAGAEAGLAWRNTRVRDGGVLPGESDGWGSYPLIAPSLTVRHRLSPNLTVMLSAHNYILDVFESAQHSQSLTLGLSIR